MFISLNILKGLNVMQIDLNGKKCVKTEYFFQDQVPENYFEVGAHNLLASQVHISQVNGCSVCLDWREKLECRFFKCAQVVKGRQQGTNISHGHLKPPTSSESMKETEGHHPTGHGAGWEAQQPAVGQPSAAMEEAKTVLDVRQKPDTAEPASEKICLDFCFSMPVLPTV